MERADTNEGRSDKNNDFMYVYVIVNDRDSQARPKQFERVLEKEDAGSIIDTIWTFGQKRSANSNASHTKH